MAEHPDTDKDHALAVSVKAINDTLGPEGFVPSSLVFGEFPTIHTDSERRASRPTTAERASVVESARTEMEKIMAELRIRRSLHHSVPPASDNTYAKGDQFLVWREKVVAGLIGEWDGPYPVHAYEKERKIVTIEDQKGKLK